MEYIVCEMCCDAECGCGMEIVDVEWCVMWADMLCFETWWCEMVVGGRLRCNVRDVRCRTWRSEVGCVAALNVCGVEHVTCSNAMWNVQWWCDMMWNGVV